MVIDATNFPPLDPVAVLAYFSVLGVAVQVEGDELVLTPSFRVPAWLTAWSDGREAEVVELVRRDAALLDRMGAAAPDPAPRPTEPRLRMLPGLGVGS